MAYFLRNTGPPAGRDAGHEEKKQSPKRILSNGLFKRKRDGTCSRSVSLETSLGNFIPSERVLQKVSRDGKKYLQIISTDQDKGPSQMSTHLNTSSASPKPARNSVSFADQSDSVSTEALYDLLAGMDVNNPRYDGIRPPDFMSQSGYYNHQPKPPIPPPFPQVNSGLSIIEESGDLATRKTEVGKPLGSHPPPSVLATPCRLRSVSIETKYFTTGNSATYEHYQLATPQDSNKRDPQDHIESKEALRYRQIYDPLAGQGMRRPLKEESVQPAQMAVPGVAESTVSIPEQHETTSADDNCMDLAEARPDALEFTRKKREQKARARKIRELQEHQHQHQHQQHQRERERLCSKPLMKIEMTSDRPPQILESSVDIIELPAEDAEQPCAAILDSTPLPSRETSFTPLSAAVSSSPATLVAEKRPIPRSNHVVEPVKLVLHDRRVSKPTAAAVRSESPKPAANTYPIHTSTSPQLEPAQTSISPASQRSPRSTSPTLLRPIIASPPSHPTPRRAVSTRDNGTGLKHLPGVVLGAQFPAPPQAVTAAAANKRASVCSSHTSASKEMRLEARLEALERENRLLEAALMAVLKTSGTLNRCPCVLLGKGEEGQQVQAAGASAAPCSSPGGAAKDAAPARARGAVAVAGAAEDGAGAGERRGSAGSQGSAASGVSALDVYLRTRLGAAAVQTAASS